MCKTELSRISLQLLCLRSERSFLPFLLLRHLGIELEERLEPFRIVFKPATDVDSFERFIISIVSGAKVIRHCFWIVEFCERRGPVASRTSRTFSAHRVRSALFSSDKGGIGNVFHPKVFE